MDRLYIGIDVSKDRLDVHVLPTAESFFVARTSAGLGELIAKLRNFGVAAAIAVEATGGFERIVAAGLASANLPVVIVNPAQVRDFAKGLANAPKPIRSTHL
jgi:transposase